MADKTSEILQTLIVGMKKMEDALHDHAARINVLTVAIAVALEGEQAQTVIQTFDELRRQLLGSASTDLTPETIAAMMAALKGGNFGRA